MASNVHVIVFHDDMTKPGGSNVSNIVKFHRSQQGNLDVSVHFNAVAGGIKEAGIGVETLHKTGNNSMRSLAGAVSKAIADDSGIILRHSRNVVPGAVARDNLGFLNGLSNSILLEVCFVNSRDDVTKYTKNFENICQGIAKVIGNLSSIPQNVPTTLELPNVFAEQNGKTFPIEAANIQLMVDNGIIGSPEYWGKINSLEWLNELFNNAGTSGVLSKNTGRNITSVDEALELLTAVGIMNSPDYWRAAIVANKIEHLGAVIVRMANAVSTSYDTTTA